MRFWSTQGLSLNRMVWISEVHGRAISWLGHWHLTKVQQWHSQHRRQLVWCWKNCLKWRHMCVLMTRFPFKQRTMDTQVNVRWWCKSFFELFLPWPVQSPQGSWRCPVTGTHCVMRMVEHQNDNNTKTQKIIILFIVWKSERETKRRMNRIIGRGADWMEFAWTSHTSSRLTQKKVTHSSHLRLSSSIQSLLHHFTM